MVSLPTFTLSCMSYRQSWKFGILDVPAERVKLSGPGVHIPPSRKGFSIHHCSLSCLSWSLPYVRLHDLLSSTVLLPPISVLAFLVWYSCV